MSTNTKNEKNAQNKKQQDPLLFPKIVFGGIIIVAALVAATIAFLALRRWPVAAAIVATAVGIVAAWFAVKPAGKVARSWSTREAKAAAAKQLASRNGDKDEEEAKPKAKKVEVK